MFCCGALSPHLPLLQGSLLHCHHSTLAPAAQDSSAMHIPPALPGCSTPNMPGHGNATWRKPRLRTVAARPFPQFSHLSSAEKKGRKEQEQHQLCHLLHHYISQTITALDRWHGRTTSHLSQQNFHIRMFKFTATQVLRDSVPRNLVILSVSCLIPLFCLKNNLDFEQKYGNKSLPFWKLKEVLHQLACLCYGIKPQLIGPTFRPGNLKFPSIHYTF